MYHSQIFFFCLVSSLFPDTTLALPGFGPSATFIHSKIRSIIPSLNPLDILSSTTSLHARSTLDVNPNGTTFLWLPQDEYSGSTFFDNFTFYTGPDPTHGTVNFTDSVTAFSSGLAFVQDNGVVIMQGDNFTTLAEGVNRNSVRISSNKQYNTGLFILDINQAPWGCGVWPAFWTVGGGTWPLTGEIDIIEGVHDNEHNQVTWHTGPNCTLNATASFTGTVVQTNGANNTNCDGNDNDNAGCGITEWSRASYGPFFDQQGGGVFAMKWDENGIAVWSFYRAAIPQDVQAGSPNPSGWGEPVAQLLPDACDPISNFVNHSIIFDITFCGDWAGNSYATSGCPGTCSSQLMEPSNFNNATWSINSLKVYRKQLLTGQISNGAPTHSSRHWNIVQFTAAALLLAIVSVII
ncbi:concanavalin A-like lectin/glucanase domain-containing protein [Rhodocollybia butyracea]|uniref:Concanavalin A-like lectin/glucanase domain-containing protein n=1 Tax=Rhodocollybia butyracea TaxID=206335 RepID=A0A9P5Q7Y9_9AGAR|nr:concanavalin A-like lectin/glucanase domain-containing protein [Rhodocollybia butyracea]